MTDFRHPSGTTNQTNRQSDRLGLYVSVPFCRSKCTYCNFASGVYPATDHERYVARLIEDLKAAPRWAKSMQVVLPSRADSIYFGGGTPVLLAPELLTQLFAAIRKRFKVDLDAEITVECAPGQLTDATLEAMVAAGVNRVSLGVQSFVDREAQLSGRLHTRAMVLEDLRRLRAAGILNLNIDLLAGLAEQTLASWHESLSVLLDTEVPHASIYMLEIDEDSRLGSELLHGGTRYGAGLVPADDTIARMYEEAIGVLARGGLEQYEISNFARKSSPRLARKRVAPPAETLDFKSRHNLRYWRRQPYLGIGVDASSMLCSADGSVLRATMTSDLSEYLAGNFRTLQASGLETAWQGHVQQLEEAWFLGLRLNDGVSLAALRQEFGKEAVAPCVDVARRLAQNGLVMMAAGRVWLTDLGRLISNEVFQEFLGLGLHSEESHHTVPVHTS